MSSVIMLENSVPRMLLKFMVSRQLARSFGLRSSACVPLTGVHIIPNRAGYGYATVSTRTKIPAGAGIFKRMRQSPTLALRLPSAVRA